MHLAHGFFSMALACQLLSVLRQQRVRVGKGKPQSWEASRLVPCPHRCLLCDTDQSPRTHLEGLCKGTNYFGYKLLAENAFKV